MTLRLLAPAALAAILAALPATASAQQDWGVFSALTLTSDYRFQGVSSSDNHPALQGYVHWQNKAGLYVGVFASQVDYNDYGTSYEIDTYAGRHFDLADGKTQITPELMYSTFPDNETPGPTYDFLQAKLSAERTEGRLKMKATVAFTPQASYGAGQAGLLQTQASYVVTDKLKLDASLGRYWVDRRPDRTFWSAGASYQWKTVTLDLRYEATDLSRRECGFNPNICGPAVVGRLTVALPPIY
jgi:uncharacterized protein (TIGR02001 family)